MREKQIKPLVEREPREPTVEREASNKPARERSRSVDKADPYPGLKRRSLFRERDSTE